MSMQRYRNRSGSSGILSFETGEDHGEQFIDVLFAGGTIYRYTARRPGPRDVAHMMELARRGEGLATFIRNHVRTRYDSKREP